MPTCRGKVALVTGAAGRGMGRSIALTLAREGACVAVNTLHGWERAEAIVEHIRERGGQAMAIQADVFSSQGCQALVEEAFGYFGKIDICVIGPGGGWHPEPVHELDGEAALSDARQELAPIYYLLPRVLPGMYERRWGRVIAISLLAPHTSPAYAYNVAKAARTEAMLLAKDAAWKQGVTVNQIAPGPVNGIETLEEAIDQCYHGPAWENRSQVSPQDIAEGVAFLCSEAGRFITGCSLPYVF